MDINKKKRVKESIKKATCQNGSKTSTLTKTRKRVKKYVGQGR